MQASVRTFRPKQSLLVICLMAILIGTGGKSWGQVISENFQSWTSRTGYTTYTQSGSGGTWTGTRNIVAPSGAASGTGSVGYVQFEASTGILELPVIATGGAGTLTFAARVSSASTQGVTIEKKIGSAGTWTAVQSFTSDLTTTGKTFTVTINDVSNNLYLRFNTTAYNRAFYLHDASVTTGATSNPSLSVSPSSRTGFTYIQGSGPSASQSFAVTGSNLSPASGNLTVTGSTNYEVSSDNTTFGNTATIAYTGGALTSVSAYVRLKAGLPVGTYNTEAIAVSGGTASNANLTVSGSVTPPTPTITSISPSSTVVGTTGPLTVTITGTNFISGTTTATYKGTSTPVTFLSATQVSINLSTADMAAGGTFPIVITNTGNSTTATASFTVSVPTPTITSLSPPSQQVGTAGPVIVNITGTNFISGITTATYNGTAKAVTFISATQVSISLATADMAAGGTFSIVITNTGNSTTATASFTVTVPVPTITSLSPASLQVGSAGQTLTINGTNFINATVTKASYNGTNKTVTFVSATQITISLSTADLATGGTYPVVVTNTGNSTTASAGFIVTVPTPTILSISPSSVTAGAAAQTLTINGTNFINSTVTTATYNGTAKPVTFVSATQISIQLSAAEQLTPGSYPVVVANTGNNTSATASFTVLACVAPITQATGVNFTGISTTSFTVRWTNGNGTGRIAIINTTNTFVDPVNGTVLPTANTVYIGSGQQVIYAGTANNVTVTGLTTATTYYVRVYEYNNCSGTYNYQTATDVDNPGMGITLDANGCSALLTENFDYGSVASSDLTAVSSGTWKNLSSTATTTKVNYTPSRGLVYPGYANGSIGGSVNVVGANASDVYRNIGTTVSSGTLYMSFLMNFAAATITTNSYFLTFKDDNTSSNYYAKLAPLQSTATTYSLGLTKYQGVSTYTGTYNYGQTYLVVLKYSFVAGASNDSTKAWVLSSTLPVSEASAGTPTLIATDVTSQPDAPSIGTIAIRQASGNNGYIDGIRVATTWSDAVCIGSTTPITYIWQPVSGSASFATASNWSPQRGTPRNTDILEFSKPGTSVATGVVSQGLGAIRVINGTSVALQSSVPVALGINNDATIADSADLYVSAGSSFNINSNSPIQLNLIGKASASFYGNVTFNNASTAGTPARPHRLTADSVSAVTFRNGSIFTGDDISGSVFENDSSYLGGNLGTVRNGVVFQSGSTYRFLDGANPFGESLTPQPASAVAFNSGSTYIHLLGTTDPSFAGRTYGNFEYNPTTGTSTISSSVTAATILNNFTVTSGTLNFTNASQPLNVGGNISVATNATLNYSPSSATSATLTLNGTTPQTISGAGTFTLGSNATLSANNATGVSLLRDVTVGGTLNLASGSFAVGANTLTLNGPAITGTPTNLTTTLASSLSYGGSSSGIIIPSSVAQLNNLIVSKTANGISLGGSTSVNGALTLTNGIVTTTSANALTVANTASGAIVGGSTTAFINGPLKRTLPTVSNSASAYAFPVGKASVYLPFSLSAFTTTANPVVSVEAFNTNSGGTAGTGLCAISNSEYWLASASAGYSTGSVSLTRQAALGNLNKIGRSATLTGIYNSLNGTVSGTSVINSDPTGTSLGYFVMGTYTEISGLAYTLNPASYCVGNTIATNSPTFTAGAATSYSITPALPSGLSFSTSSGAITGQPLVASPATVYTIIATNATGCTASVQVTITVNPLATASINGPNATLCPGSTSGVTITNTGTTPATITYTTQISGGSVVSHQVTLAAGSGTTLSDVVNATTTYTLVSVDNGTCPNNAPNAQVTVNVYPLPAVPASITGNNFVAVGATVQLTGAPSGGLWSIDNTTLADFATGNNNLTNPVLITGKAAGTPTITYTLTDNNGCTNKASVLLTVYDASLARYRSKQDGKASDASTWEVYTGTGNNWENTSNPPTNSSNIEIRHNVSIQDVNYEGASGATLTITSHTANSTTVTGTLTVYPGRIFQSQGSVNFNNNLVVLRSDVSGTAAIGFMTTPIANATNVQVENYTDARKLNALGTALIGSPRRTWRLITSPVTGQTIHEAWQENQALNVNPGTGFGTLITGEGLSTSGATTGGFDLTSAGNHTSIRQYDSSTNQWKILSTNANLGTNIPLQSHQGYMVFIRGDRSVSTGTATIANLRATGTLKQGDQPVPIVPNEVIGGSPVDRYTVVGNPYAAPVNFSAIIGHNATIKNEFYLWNSHLANYGAYVLVQDDGNGTGNYVAIPQPLTNNPQPGSIAGNTYQYIPAGAAFLVSPLGTTSTTLTISEGDKAAGDAPPVNPFRVQSQNSKQLWVNLNLKDDDTSATLADGFVAKFDEAFAGNEEESSSQKAWNFNENLNVVRNGKSHIAEAHNDVKNTDTLFVQMWNVTERNYQLQMRADHFDSLLSTQAWLIDNYKGTKDEISLKGGVVTVNFDVTKDTASSKTDRFMIVFKNTASVLPVTLTSVKASQQDGGVQVNWTVTNEVNVKGYTVEKSPDGRNFTPVGTQQLARNNPQAALTSYTGYDATPQMGNNYYRIRTEGKDGVVSYSQVVTVTISRTGTGIQITLYPNPVREGKANLSLSNLQEGTYLVSVFSGSGQTVYQKKVTVTLAGNTQTEQLLLGKSLAQGSYQIRVADSKGNILYSDKLVVGK